MNSFELEPNTPVRILPSFTCGTVLEHDHEYKLTKVLTNDGAFWYFTEALVEREER